MKYGRESYCYNMEKEKSKNWNTVWKIRKDNIAQGKGGFGDRISYNQDVPYSKYSIR
jgi:hypothetical protein